MRDKLNSAVHVLLGLLWLWGSCNASGQDMLTKPTTLFGLNWPGFEQASDTGDLHWNIKLSKSSYLAGEPILATIQVTNRSKNAIKISPPYNGAFVSTLDAWLQPLGPGKSGGAAGFEQLLAFNRGNVDDPNFQLQGKPIVLQPSESYSSEVVLNLQFDRSIQDLSPWFSVNSGISPGRYRIYVRYLNFENLLPYADRHLGAKKFGERVYSAQAQGPASPPELATILPPQEVEITAIPPALSALGEKIAPKQDYGSDMVRSHGLDPGIAGTVKAALAPWLEDREGPLASLAQLFLLETLFHEAAALSSQPLAPEARLKISKSLEEQISRLADGPLKDSAQVSLGYFLFKSDGPNKGTSILEAVKTPDSEVLLDTMIQAR